MGNIGMMFIPTDSTDDVLKADEEDLAYTTKYNTLKQTQTIDDAGPLTLSGLSNDYEEVTFIHNLGYKPAYEIYFEDHDGRMFQLPGRSDDLASPSCGIISTQTNNDITIRVGYYGGTTHPHSHDRQIICVIYIESEIT